MTGFTPHPTPNPDSLKVTTTNGLFIESGMESFASAEQAADHPLGSRLFAVPGIANVFLLPQFATVTKESDANWDTVWPAVRQVLEEAIPSSRTKPGEE